MANKADDTYLYATTVAASTMGAGIIIGNVGFHIVLGVVCFFLVVLLGRAMKPRESDGNSNSEIDGNGNGESSH